jgi:hypothetical protein
MTASLSTTHYRTRVNRREGGPWRVQITEVSGRQRLIGYAETKEEAAEKRKAYYDGIKSNSDRKLPNGPGA